MFFIEEFESWTDEGMLSLKFEKEVVEEGMDNSWRMNFRVFDEHLPILARVNFTLIASI